MQTLTCHVRRLLVVTVVVLGVVWASGVAAGEPVTVWLRDGRAISSEIDSRSTSEKLWLRSGGGKIVVRRAIPWANIVKAERDGEELSVADLRRLASEAAASPKVPAPAVPSPALQGVFVRPTPGVETVPVLPNIRSLEVDAFIANWDADLLQDGLVVVLEPTDAYGALAPVDGTLEVELFVPQVRPFHEAVRSRGMTLENIGRWTRAISPSDFTARGAAIELPFQAVIPELDQEYQPWGLVHIKLAVPGQAVFERTVEYVRVRPWSPLRDLYGRHQNRRFLPTERYRDF
jgi:hypothetical protein